VSSSSPSATVDKTRNIPPLPSADVHEKADRFLTRIRRERRERARKSKSTSNTDDYPHLHHHLKNRQKERGVHYTKEGKLVHHDGHVWTVKDELDQYKKDIEEDEKLAEILEQEDSKLVEVSFEKSIELERLQEEFRHVSGDVQKLIRRIAEETERKRTLTTSVETLKRELDASRGRVVIEKERYHQKMIKIKSMEAEMKSRFVQEQKTYETKELELDEEINGLEDKLEEARKMKVEITRLEEDVKIRNHEIERMKESLVLSKECTLHEAVNAAAIAAKEECDKLHHIIAHLQKELKVTTHATDALEAEHNVLREQLLDYENQHRALAKAEESADNDGSVSSPVVGALARRVVSESPEAKQKRLESLEEDLKRELDAERAKARELAERIRKERASHEATQSEYAKRVGKDIEALKTYIAELESKI